MRNHSMSRKGFLVLAWGVLFCVSQGCTYLKHRGEDATEMLELGVTWSKTPYGSFYVCGGGLATAGVGHMNGRFAGIGGSKVGATRHYYKLLGLLLWSYEEIGWGEFDPAKPETLDRQHVGLLGWIMHPERRPAYAFGCVHCFHAGYAGLVFNARYVEVLDFLFGWFGLDLAGDDGERFGRWPWQAKDAKNAPRRPRLRF